MSPADLSGIVFEDATQQNKGVNFNSYVERKGLAVAGVSQDGRVIIDASRAKLLRAIRPRITGDAGAVVDVYVGSHDSPEEAVTWATVLKFTIGTTIELGENLSGRYLAVKFEDTLANNWELHGYELDVVPLGEF
jgi:hypothetical protein